MTDIDFMNEALDLARHCSKLGEVPVGSVVVIDGRVVGRGFNRRELMGSALEHAEIMALKEAFNNLGHWRLKDATVYSTLEPCLMCSGALLHARIKRLVFAAHDPKFGAIVSLYNLACDKRLNHSFCYEEGLMKKESQELLRCFFKALRLKKNNKRLFSPTTLPSCP